MRGSGFAPITELQCPVGASVSPLGPWGGPRLLVWGLREIWSLNMPKMC